MCLHAAQQDLVIDDPVVSANPRHCPAREGLRLISGNFAVEACQKPTQVAQFVRNQVSFRDALLAKAIKRVHISRLRGARRYHGAVSDYQVQSQSLTKRLPWPTVGLSPPARDCLGRGTWAIDMRHRRCAQVPYSAAEAWSRVWPLRMNPPKSPPECREY